MLLISAATTAATAQTYTDLYNFDHLQGMNPVGLLAQGRDGYLYGTTPRGGINKCFVYQRYRSCGLVFRITPSGTQKVFYNFHGADGFNPVGGLTLGTDGNFYGTAEYGGPNSWYGTIFKITKRAILTTLYSWTPNDNSEFPEAAPIEGNDGNFYGTTAGGGGNSSAYKITPSGTFTTFGLLPGGSGSPLLQATDGNFYGSLEPGTVFKMTPEGILTIVYQFDGVHGLYPNGPVIQGSDGNFYGTTGAGGSNNECTNGCGVAFKLTPQGVITVLHNFGDPNYPNDGTGPSAGLAQATDGNFYGTTYSGGTAYNGVIFQITPDGAYSILYNFDGTHGAYPQSTLLQHTNGKIYGLTPLGGTHNKGVVYRLDVGLAPFISLVSTLGKIGKTVEVLGQGFTGTTAVSFNGTAATFTVKSDTYLTAAVPAGATTGFVTVTTPSGTLTSNKPFRVGPLILSFTPTSGPVGTSVTITGSGLTQTNKVAFGGVLATNFTVNSDTQVTATVPTGAKTGHIGIITTGGQTYSQATFTVTQ